MVGEPLGLHGHGQRERQVRGPLAPQQPPQMWVIRMRRYQCQRCGATLTVGPQGVLARRLFSAAAIGLALCLWGLVYQCAKKVREQVSPWRCVGVTAASSWMQLRRWAEAVKQRRLFCGLVLGPPCAGRRDVAQRVALALSALCPPQGFGQSMPEQVFVGAARAP